MTRIQYNVRARYLDANSKSRLVKHYVIVVVVLGLDSSVTLFFGTTWIAHPSS